MSSAAAICGKNVVVSREYAGTEYVHCANCHDDCVNKRILDLQNEIATLEKQHEDVMVSLELFELGERIKRNPKALAGLAPAAWGPLPLAIEKLYEEQWELASEIDLLGGIAFLSSALTSELKLLSHAEADTELCNRYQK